MCCPLRVNRLMASATRIWIVSKNRRRSAYLPGSGDTLISKEVPPGRGLSIALRLGWPLRFPQMWETREHNLWELGTAFALSPQSKPGLSLLCSSMPHLYIAVKSKNNQFILPSNFSCSSDQSFFFNFCLIFIFEPIFQNKQSNNSFSFYCW